MMDADSTADVKKINALEAPYDPDDADLPSSWTDEHVGRRLVEAFTLLRSMPGVRGPREPGANWPQYSYTAEDRHGWEQFRSDRDAEQNRAVVKPTSRDIWRMEQSLGWVDLLRRHDAGLALTVQEWGTARACERPILYMCREKGWGVSGFYKRLNRALGWISCELNLTAFAVF